MVSEVEVTAQLYSHLGSKVVARKRGREEESREAEMRGMQGK